MSYAAVEIFLIFFAIIFGTAILLVIYPVLFPRTIEEIGRSTMRSVRARKLLPEFERAIDSARMNQRTSREVGRRLGNLLNPNLLHQKMVFIAGCGAMGSWLAYYLAMNHVRNIFLLDFDRVEEGNLAGRTVYLQNQLGSLKSIALSEFLESLDSGIFAYPIVEKADILLDDRIAERLANFHLLVNTFDDMDMLLKINAKYYRQIPQLFAGFHRNGESGHAIFTIPNSTPCFACSMDVRRARRLRRIDQAVALPNDIQRIALRAAEIALSILTGDQPACPFNQRRQLWQSNYLFISNRDENSYRGVWMPTRRRQACEVCRDR